MSTPVSDQRVGEGGRVVRLDPEGFSWPDWLTWRCPRCNTRSYCHIHESKPGGGYGPGPKIRCLHCKDVFSPPEPDHALSVPVSLAEVPPTGSTAWLQVLSALQIAHTRMGAAMHYLNEGTQAHVILTKGRKKASEALTAWNAERASSTPISDRTSDEPRQSLSTQGQEDALREEQGGNGAVRDAAQALVDSASHPFGEGAVRVDAGKLSALRAALDEGADGGAEPSGMAWATVAYRARNALVALEIDEAVAAAVIYTTEGPKLEQAKWLWLDRDEGDNGLLTFDPWLKAGSQAPYIRGDIVARLVSKMAAPPVIQSDLGSDAHV